jgi:DNA mismatch repair protein MutS
MAAPAEQQLSLVADLAGAGWQGNLFGQPSVKEATGVEGQAALPDRGDQEAALDADHLLEADAVARPRKRQAKAQSRAAEGVPDTSPAGSGLTRGQVAPRSLPEPSEEGSSGTTNAWKADDAPGASGPETRRGETPPAPTGAQPAADTASSIADTETAEPSDTDLPRWHHHSLVDPAALTPVLRHYVELKAACPDRVLLYRLGDFYEFFFEDALLLSRLLELTLTGKEGGKGIGRVPMAGIPHHAAERYCAELVRRGLSVALCDQLEATPAKGALLRRDITRVLTPGTVLEEGMLTARRNNWLCAVVISGGCWGLAVADVSTGEFRVTEREGSGALHQELLRLEAAEVIWPAPEAGGVESCTTVRASGSQAVAAPESAPPWCPEPQRLTALPRTPFEAPQARARLLGHFRLASLDGLGLGELPLATRAAGGLLAYLDTTQPTPEGPSDPGGEAVACPERVPADPAPQTDVAPPQQGDGDSASPGRDPDHAASHEPETGSPRIPLELPCVWHAGDQLVLDAQTRRNLELTRTQLGGGHHGSLLWALDRTATAMGGRCLRRWIEAPLVDRAAIESRQEAVGELVEHRPLRLALRRLLRPMGDLERLAGRAGAGSASARDLVALADGLERLPRLAGLLKDSSSQPLRALARPWPDLVILAEELRHHLHEAPPLSLRDGGLIHDGVDPLLDGLRNQLDDQDAWLAEQEANERRASGNANLRLQYHRSFGYFLAVSRARAASVPEHWIRRQTLANEERFVTAALKGREGRILQLRARAAQREYDLFTALRARVGERAAPIRAAARLVAELDALASLADVAATGGWCRPELVEGRTDYRT